MSEQLACKKHDCAKRFKEAQELFNRYRLEAPELFAYQRPKMPMSKRTAEMMEQYKDRIIRDSLYKHHLKKLFYGTEREKSEEIAKDEAGYYKKHSDYQKKRL